MLSQLEPDAVLAEINPQRLDEVQQRTTAVHEATGRARHIKAQYNLAANRNVKFYLEPSVEWVPEEIETLKFLCGAGQIDMADGYEVPAGTPAFLTPLGKMYMPLEGLVDIDAERDRILREQKKLQKEMDQVVSKLSNAKFVERAPQDVVEETKTRRESLKASIEQLDEMLENLS